MKRIGGAVLGLFLGAFAGSLVCALMLLVAFLIGLLTLTNLNVAEWLINTLRLDSPLPYTLVVSVSCLGFAVVGWVYGIGIYTQKNQG